MTDGDETVLFEELPPKAAVGGHRFVGHRPWLRALMARPGEWARVPQLKASGGVANYYAAIGIRLEVARRTVDGEVRIYVRYLDGTDA